MKNETVTLNQRLGRVPRTRADRVVSAYEHWVARRRFHEALRVQERPLEQILPGTGDAQAIIQAAVRTAHSYANMPVAELVILSTICAHVKPTVIFEFGTYDGLTTFHLALNSPPSTQVYTIDLAPDDPLRSVASDDIAYPSEVAIGAHFQGTPQAGKIEQIFGDTTQYDHTALRGKVDMIFIDAGHSYDLVRSDSEKALEMSSGRGMIVWHDFHYTQDGVYTWLNELAVSRELYNLPGTSLVCWLNSH